MLLTKEQADARLTSPQNLVHKTEVNNGRLKVVSINRGGHTNKGKTQTQFTDEERALIATTAQVSGAVMATAEAFGVSRESLTNWGNGRNSRVQTGREQNQPLTNMIEERLGIVRDIALDKLMESLNLMDNEKIKNLNPIQQSTIASNLARVVEKTTSKDVNISKSNVIIYAPRQRSMDSFDIVES